MYFEIMKIMCCMDSEAKVIKKVSSEKAIGEESRTP